MRMVAAPGIAPECEAEAASDLRAGQQGYECPALLHVLQSMRLVRYLPSHFSSSPPCTRAQTAAARSLGRRLLSSSFGLDSALLVEGLEITDDLRDRRSQLPHYLTNVLRSQPLLSPPSLTSAKSR